MKIKKKKCQKISFKKKKEIEEGINHYDEKSNKRFEFRTRNGENNSSMDVFLTSFQIPYFGWNFLLLV